MTVILGIDPGGTTGVVKFSTADYKVLGWSHYDTESITEVSDVILKLQINHLNNCHVVIEDFVGSGPRSSDMTQTIKMVGFFEHLCTWKKIPYTMQHPQKRLSTIARAHEIKSPTPLSSHAIDALAHVLAYLESGN